MCHFLSVESNILTSCWNVMSKCPHVRGRPYTHGSQHHFDWCWTSPTKQSKSERYGEACIISFMLQWERVRRKGTNANLVMLQTKPSKFVYSVSAIDSVARITCCLPGLLLFQLSLLHFCQSQQERVHGTKRHKTLEFQLSSDLAMCFFSIRTIYQWSSHFSYRASKKLCQKSWTVVSCHHHQQKLKAHRTFKPSNTVKISVWDITDAIWETRPTHYRFQKGK